MARTEAEVAADTILALLHGRVFKPGRLADTLARASAAAHVSMDELRRAAARWDHRGRSVAPDRAAHAEGPELPLPDIPPPLAAPPIPSIEPALAKLARLLGDVDAADYLAPGIDDREPGIAVRQPAKRRGGHRGPRLREEQQLCLACHRTKAISRFRIANTDTGRHSRTCIPCEDDRRTRVLDVTRDEPLGSVRLAFMVHEGDQIDGVCCVECEAKIKAGELVYTHGALHHEACPAWTGTRLRVPAAFTRRDR